jgi:hypothetical protein
MQKAPKRFGAFFISNPVLVGYRLTFRFWEMIYSFSVFLEKQV